ncbi:MAG: stringent starvation protein A [Gammaproteobacteria bacterium]|jgi:RNA polymerase-associated protein|nr:stringent starvation protein A [Gammaproteobacteria bacterium]MBT3725051.1 stringent starvation protein A [Gammaproteobacteria bacterium]MBT4076315.1 stringent starvation protein A [Gammaproteobacteria bacterium]MBT4194785.1 stringent starvation protein A [Gammaproteobacteria bacterium]MBT4450756.1 stringent starvation protein A [Gammaproteobacteria bacterium]
MSAVANRRSVMTCFSSPVDPQCHRSRIVLAEKDITVEIYDVDMDDLPEDLLDLNPYATVPTMVDRDLVLYDARVLIEYLDERFPHPPLMPVDPVSRAKSRLGLFRIESDWYSLLPDIEHGSETKKAQAKKALTESLVNSIDVFAAMPYFLSDDFSLLDCSIAPILWRLPYYEIELPSDAKPITDYMKRVFSRPSFQNSLSEQERDMVE